MTNPIATECDACPNVEVLTSIGKLKLCAACLAKEREVIELAKHEVEVTPSTEPINTRLRTAYIDKFNTVILSGMSHAQVKEHIADLEDMVKVLQTQIQATMDVDDDWSSKISVEEREALRAADKAYRAKARPNMKSDGTLKTGNAKTAKPVIVGDSGTKAFDSLVEKLVRTGMSKEMAENMIRGMKGQK